MRYTRQVVPTEWFGHPLDRVAAITESMRLAIQGCLASGFNASRRIWVHYDRFTSPEGVVFLKERKPHVRSNVRERQAYPRGFG